MEKFKKAITRAVPILCIITSILVMLYLFHYIDNMVVVFVMSALTFIVSALNLLVIIISKKK